MWRIGHVAWLSMWLAVLAVLAYFAVNSGMSNYEAGQSRDLLGDVLAVAFLAMLAIWCGRQLLRVLNCPSAREWERKYAQRVNMYL